MAYRKIILILTCWTIGGCYEKFCRLLVVQNTYLTCLDH